MMFWILVTSAVMCQLLTASALLTCQTCDQTFKPLSSSNINTTNCLSSQTSAQVCTALLNIDYASDSGTIRFEGGAANYANLLNGTDMIKHNMEITLNNNRFSRILQLFCFKNDSCSADMKRIYNEGKKLNHTNLQNLLRTQLYNVSSSGDRLTCANNAGQEIPCPNGCCELSQRGLFNFDRKCTNNPCVDNQNVVIESQVIGQINTESTFMYRCNKPMCNDRRNGDKVHDILKSNGLLTPTGTIPDPPNTAVTVLSHTSAITQCILMIAITLFSKYN